MSRSAVALRAFNVSGEPFAAKDQVLLDLADGHFADWEAIDLVRAATEEEEAAARAALAAAPAPQEPHTSEEEETPSAAVDETAA